MNYKAKRYIAFFIFSIFIISDLSYLRSANHKEFSLSDQNENYRYRLGPGDKLSVRVFNMPDFEAIANILPDGTINLPRIGTIFLKGSTLDSAKFKLEKRYSKILKNPIIYLDIVSTRPIRFNITGEVQRPGIYSLTIDEVNQLANSDGGEASSVRSSGWPTVVEAIQKAGGITSKGDLRSVILTRNDPLENDIQQININYWQSLKTGSLAYNPLIYDGDSIRVNKAEIIPQDDILTISSSSFAPASITVNVIGEVKRPGPQRVLANSPLTKAILSAGGPNENANKSNVKLIRLLTNGSVEVKNIAFEVNKGLDYKSNPPLQDGDVIVVNKNIRAKINTGLRAIIEPVNPIISGFTLYKLIGDLGD